MKIITIDNISIELIYKNIKNIHLRMYPSTGKIRMTAPFRANEATIQGFALSKMEWIKRNQKKYSEQEKLSPREYTQHEQHYFLGKTYTLNIIETDGTPRVILNDKDNIDFYIRSRTPLQKREELLTEWYRDQIKKRIPPFISKWEKILGVQINDWYVRKMKSKWGSCHIGRKRVCLNLELVKRSERCLEYVIVHELLHLKERLHNKRFYAFLDKYFPDWKKYKSELKIPR